MRLFDWRKSKGLSLRAAAARISKEGGGSITGEYVRQLEAGACSPALAMMDLIKRGTGGAVTRMDWPESDARDAEHERTCRMSETLLDIAESALVEAHGNCEEYGKPDHRVSIRDCPKHGEAWLTVWRAKHMGVTPEQWAASSVNPRTAETFRETPPASPLDALKGATERMEKVATPTTATMLGEAMGYVLMALDLLDKADPAGEHLSFVPVVVKGNRFHDALEEIKREAEARETPNGR